MCEESGSELGASVDALVDEVVSRVAALSPADALRALASAQARLTAAHLAVMQRADSEGTYCETHQNVTSWAREVMNVDWSEARRLHGRARSAERLPGMLGALAAGAVTVAHLDVVARGLRSAAEEQVRAVEPFLVEASKVATPGEVAKVLEHVRAQTDPERQEQRERDHYEDRSLHISSSFDGQVHLRGRFDAVSGGILVAAIAAFSAPERQPDGARDPRLPMQRRADALRTICEIALDTSSERTRAGVAQMLLLVDANRLRRDTARHRDPSMRPALFGQTGDGTTLSPAAIDQLACDARIALAVVDDTTAAFLPRALRRSHPEPLFLGRSTRVVSAGLRRALVLRDRGCAMPGCTAPASWCEAHHLQPWQFGGTTDLPNMALLCGHHHHWLHANRRNLERGADGAWSVIDDPLSSDRVRAFPDRPPPPARAA